MNYKALFVALFLLVLLPFVYSQTYLLAYVDKEEVNVGDVVKVYGYVMRDENKEGVYVHIFLNDALVRSIKSDKKGYYETFIPINEPGINIVKVIVGEESKELQIVAKQPSETPRIIYSDEDYDVVIIVDETTHVIWKGEEKDEDKKQYVDFSISTHELDVREYGGSKLLISIENNMNTTHLFNVTTTLPSRDYYTSGILELKPGQQGEIVIFIKPLSWDEIIGKDHKVIIYMDGEKIGEEVFTISKIPRKSHIFDKVGRVEMVALTLMVLGVAALGIGFFIKMRV